MSQQGWAKVDRAPSAITDPRTLLVVGTKGTRAIDTDCQVATYRVPVDGAVVVVIGWRESIGGDQLAPARRHEAPA